MSGLSSLTYNNSAWDGYDLSTITPEDHANAFNVGLGIWGGAVGGGAVAFVRGTAVVPAMLEGGFASGLMSLFLTQAEQISQPESLGTPGEALNSGNYSNSAEEVGGQHEGDFFGGTTGDNFDDSGYSYSGSW